MSARTTEFAAKVTGDANSALAALERVKERVTATGTATESANTKVAASTDRLVKNSEKAARGVAAITQALYSMEAEGSAKVLALGGAVGSFADLLGPQGKVVSGISIVTSSIVALFLQAQEKSKEARKAIEEDLKGLINAGDFTAITKKLRDLEVGSAASGYTDGIRTRRETIELLREELRLIDTGTRTFSSYSARQKERREITETLNRERAALKPLVDEWQRYNRALTSPRNAPTATRGLAGSTVTTTSDTPEAIAKAAAAATAKVEELRKKSRELQLEFRNVDDIEKAAFKIREWEREADRSSMSAAELAETVNALSEALKRGAAASVAGKFKEFAASLQEAAANQVALTRAEEERIRLARESKEVAAIEVDRLRAQAKALASGLPIRDQEIRQRERALAISQAEARAVAESNYGSVGLDPRNDPKVISAKQQAAALFDAKTNVEDIQRQLALIADGDIAARLAMVAQDFVQIAAALGDAGVSLGRVVGILSPVLQGLSKFRSATLRPTADGQGTESIGFLKALTGGAGKAAQGDAVTAAVSWISAGVQVADALDLFGNRASEQAQILRERAVAFNKALEEFAIASRTEIESQLQQNITQANQVAGAAGFSGDFKTVAEIRDQAKAFREIAEAGRIGGNTLSAKGVEAFRGFAEQLDRLADTAADNEAKLRVANEASIQRLREDLNVRKLALAAGNDAAEQERARLDIERQEKEIREQYGIQAEDYIADLIAVAKAEAALAAEVKRRATIMAKLQDDNTILGGTAGDVLQRSIRAFGESFAQFSGLFDGTNLTSRAGLDKAKATIQELYKGLSADGISESEQPIIEFLKSLLSQIDGIAASLPDTLDPIASALEAFNARVELFGLSIPEQMAELARIFTGSFGDWFDSVLAGVDLTTEDGRTSFKDLLQGQLSAILADGVITDGERPLYEALKLMLGIVNKAIETATSEATAQAEASAKAAEQAQADALAARSKSRTFASNVVDLFDLEGLDAFTVTLYGFGQAFSDLMDQFDLSTVDGIAQAKGALRQIYIELQSMTDAQILARWGMTRDEVVSALLDTGHGLDGLATSLTDVADAAAKAATEAKAFTEQLTQDYLRSQGRDRDADIAAARLSRDNRLKQAVDMGLGPDIIAQIEAIFQSDLAKIAAKYAPTTEAPAASGGGSISSTTRPRTSTLVQDFGGLSEVTAQSMAGLLREIAINTSDVGAIVRALTGRTPLPPLSSLTFPSFAPAGGGGVTIGTVHITIGSLNPEGVPLSEVGPALVRQVSRGIGQMVAAEARYLGSAKR